MQALRILTSALVLISLATGCASKDSVLPDDLPTIRQIYDAHQQGSQQHSSNNSDYRGQTRPLIPSAADLHGYTRTAYTEIDAVFPVLPNPPLIMYVYPHLASDDNVGIPGYSTAFSLYKTTQYALPGEVPQRLPALGQELIAPVSDTDLLQVDEPTNRQPGNPSLVRVRSRR